MHEIPLLLSMEHPYNNKHHGRQSQPSAMTSSARLHHLPGALIAFDTSVKSCATVFEMSQGESLTFLTDGSSACSVAVESQSKTEEFPYDLMYRRNITKSNISARMFTNNPVFLAPGILPLCENLIKEQLLSQAAV